MYLIDLCLLMTPWFEGQDKEQGCNPNDCVYDKLKYKTYAINCCAFPCFSCYTSTYSEGLAQTSSDNSCAKAKHLKCDTCQASLTAKAQENALSTEEKAAQIFNHSALAVKDQASTLFKEEAIQEVGKILDRPTLAAKTQDSFLSKEEQVTEIFERYKKRFLNKKDVHSKYLIRQAVQCLPMCELHNHLIPDYTDNLSYAEEKQLFYDLIDKTFSKKYLDGNQITAQKLAKDPNGQLQKDYREAVTMPKGLKRDGERTAETHFFGTFKTILSTEMPLERQLTGEIKKYIKAKTPYAELTYDFSKDILKENSAIDLSDFSMDDLEGSYEKIAKTCLEYANCWMQELDRCTKAVVKNLNWQHPWNSPKNDMMVGLLAEIMRTASSNHDEKEDILPAFFFDIAAGLTLADQDPTRVLGINVVGPEHNHVASACYASQMQILNFFSKKFPKANIALHAGEITSHNSSLTDMGDRIQQSIEVGHAMRIGHGLCIDKAHNADGLLELMKEKNITVEICLKSNKKILGISKYDHPVMLYIDNNVDVVFATDDPHILNTTLTEEYRRAIQIGVKYPQIKKSIRNSIEKSFLTGKSIFKRDPENNHILKEKFKLLIDDPQIDLMSHFAQDILKGSKKAERQIIVERKLIKGEEEIIKKQEKMLSQLGIGKKNLISNA